MPSQLVLRVRELLAGTSDQDRGLAAQYVSEALFNEPGRKGMTVLASEPFQPDTELPTLLDGLLALGVISWFGIPGVAGSDIFTCSADYTIAKQSNHGTPSDKSLAKALQV